MMPPTIAVPPVARAVAMNAASRIGFSPPSEAANVPVISVAASRPASAAANPVSSIPAAPAATLPEPASALETAPAAAL